MKERTRLTARIDAVRQLENGMNDNVELIQMGEEEGDAGIVAEAEKSLSEIKAKAEKLQLQSLLSGEADGNNAFLEVHAGSGGTEAQDWAEMLLRMYTRWAEQNGYGVSLLERSEGDGAGIKSATIRIDGENAYGWLKAESGVHRLVRISPFDSNARRHTSFSSVGVSPVVDETIDIKIEEKDLRVDTYRAQGAGGQHVNKTESAVRITHVPTGIVVQCQNERSQHKNRDAAMTVLAARLAELQRQQAEQHMSTMKVTGPAEWGRQIRSYVMQPYTMVKDHRTAHETGNVSGVMDGEIDGFVEAYLKQRPSEDSYVE